MSGKVTIVLLSLFIAACAVQPIHQGLKGGDLPPLLPVDITPLENTRVGIQQIIEDDPAHILIVHNGRDKAVFDLYRLNLDSGEMTLLYENTEQVTQLVTDRQGRLRARVRPVLIVQGANDVRVKQDQSDRMVEALRAAGKDVDYRVIKGEGQRIRHWKNRLTEYRATEDFLAGCLGGRSSGFDYYQLGSWLF